MAQRVKRSPGNALGARVGYAGQAGYPPLADLAASFSALNNELCTALASSADRLEAAMPGAGLHDEKRVIDSVLFLAWHEAYHIGAICAIRREQGRKAIAELVRGAR